MKKFLVAATALSGFLALTGAASAADPVVDPGYDWSGLYIGGQVGYAWGNADHDFSNGAPSDDSSPDGFLGGAHIGYLHQMDLLVLGLEVDVEGTDINGSFNNTTGGTSSGSTDINVQGSARARLGLAMDRWLPYITGGVAIADVDYGGGPAGGPCCGYSKTSVGYTIGGGLEYAFTDSFSARVEYRFTDFGKESGGLSPTFPTVNMPVDLETHAVRFGISFHL
ncbi:MAG: outer membrane protein [Methylococcales bacterium]